MNNPKKVPKNVPQEEKDRIAALRQRQLDLQNTQKVSAYKRKTGSVSAHYKGYGPKKKIPNIHMDRLYVYFRCHGVEYNKLNDAYRFCIYTKKEVTTHDLQAAGLLDPNAYLKALEKLPKGQRF